MLNEKKDAVQKVARLMRAARKQAGASQSNIAKELGLSQATVSKIESEILTLTPDQWYSFCRYADIFPDKSWYTGYIDRCESRDLQNGNREGLFRIPTRYAHLRGSKVRAILPILKYFTYSMGPDRLTAYFKKIKMDEDFFVVLDNQLNIDFNLDLMRTMIQRGVLTKKNIAEIANFYKTPSAHGNLAETFQSEKNKMKRLVNLTEKIKNYDVNCDYRVESMSSQSLEISIAPNEHMRDFDYKDDILNDCLCHYKKEVFKAFDCLDSDSKVAAVPSMRLEELECHFHAHSPKCVYRLEFLS